MYNTPAMEARILAAARKAMPGHKGCRFAAVFDGQWYVIVTEATANGDYTYTYAVNDATGPGTIDGFVFEEL